MHKNETTTIRIPVKTVKRLDKWRSWDNEPWYSILDRVMKIASRKVKEDAGL